MPLLSVITVTFNCANCIEKTLNSVLSQSLSNNEIEYIVIDGASTDGTLEIIQRYMSKISFFTSEPDNGIYDAMNKGLAHATGDWVYFINAGDKFYNDFVLNRFSAFARNTTDSVGVIVGKIKVQEDDSIVDFPSFLVPFYRNSGKSFSMGFSHQGAFVRRELAQRMKFDLSYRLCADYKMMSEIFKAGYDFLEIDENICVSEGRSGASMEHRILQFREEARVCGREETLYFKVKLIQKALKKAIKSLFIQ